MKAMLMDLKTFESFFVESKKIIAPNGEPEVHWFDQNNVDYGTIPAYGNTQYAVMPC